MWRRSAGRRRRGRRRLAPLSPRLLPLDPRPQTCRSVDARLLSPPDPLVQTNSVPRPHSNPAGTTISADKVPKDMAKPAAAAQASKSSDDLLGLGLDFSSPVDGRPSTSAAEEDPFDAFVSASKTSSSSAAGTLSLADEESDFFNQKVPEKKLDKDSILKIFDSSNFVSSIPAAAFAGGNSISGLSSLNNNLFANTIPQGNPLQNGSAHVTHQVREGVTSLLYFPRWFFPLLTPCVAC